MDITKLMAKDVISEAALADYEKARRIFWSEIVELNVLLYLAEKIVYFPFHLFVDESRSIFFPMVSKAFYKSAILIITRLATDTDGDAYTLRRFKMNVRNWVKTCEVRDALDARLREMDFDRHIKRLLEKTKDLRNQEIAHLSKKVFDETEYISRPHLEELKSICKAVNDLFDALCFDTRHAMLPIPYNAEVIPGIGADMSNDIEKLLDGIAARSHILRMHEENPTAWQFRRPTLREQDIESINYYRQRLGLPKLS